MNIHLISHFNGDSNVTFINNEAHFGGVVHCKHSSIITFDISYPAPP